ncbi:MAG: ABC transporter ATP-binding protein [Chloroflexi bacterium]|nr:ABC transporter ATP-binding protein [Chloroflexota bacterium]
MGQIVAVQNLKKSYGSFTAVQDLTMSVDEGEVVALLGGPGAGKSTVLKVISADLKPDVGFINVCGCDSVLQAGLVRPLIGVVKHERLLEFGLSGRENLNEQAMLRFMTEDEAERRIGELLARVDLGARVDDSTATYTMDEWARLEMAACLIHRPKLLIVDEPSRGCDPAGRERVWAAFRHLRPQVISALFATTDEDEARALADRIVRL